MSSSTRELIEICEQLPEVQRQEVASYARALLARKATLAQGQRSAQVMQWLDRARGAALPATNTDQLIHQSRGED